MFSWAQIRKLIVILGLFAIIAGILLFFIFKIEKPLVEIEKKPKNPSVLWTRLFEVRDGFLDVAALLYNPNNIGVQKIVYSFKIYDKNNILIAIKEGETFAGPFDRFVVFEPNIPVHERIPSRILFDIKEILFSGDLPDQLAGVDDLFPKIDVLSTERFLEEFPPKVLVNIKNRDARSLQNIEATVILFDEDQNAMAVSRTLILFLGIGEEKTIIFTWPRALNGVSVVEVFFK